MLAGIGDSGEPYANNTNVIILSPDWQTYTLHLDANGLQGGLGRVFDMGADTGAVDIDNVAVFVGPCRYEDLETILRAIFCPTVALIHSQIGVVTRFNLWTVASRANVVRQSLKILGT